MLGVRFSVNYKSVQFSLHLLIVTIMSLTQLELSYSQYCHQSHHMSLPVSASRWSVGRDIRDHSHSDDNPLSISISHLSWQLVSFSIIRKIFIDWYNVYCYWNAVLSRLIPWNICKKNREKRWRLQHGTSEFLGFINWTQREHLQEWIVFQKTKYRKIDRNSLGLSSDCMSLLLLLDILHNTKLYARLGQNNPTMINLLQGPSCVVLPTL